MDITFEAECGDTHEGDVLCLLGSGDALGHWDAVRAVALQTSPELFPRWRGMLPSAVCGAECKLIIKRRGGHIDWEPGDNRSFPSTTAPATVRMRYGGKETDVIPGPNGYPEASASPVSLRPPSKPTSLRERFIDLRFQRNLEERYEVEKTKLGEGGFGTVTRARDKATGVRRAVKLVLKAHIPNPEFLQREIEITKRLDHPNIVRLFAVYEDHCGVYLVMELCEGGELFDRLVEEKHLTEPVVKKVMKQVFSAVAYCHSKDVVHRDLKPENFILLSKNKAVDQTPLKLIDFGLAKNSGELHTAVGTAFYVAPEVLQKNYGKEVDAWSCGVLMYCLHAGSPPFYGKTDMDVLRMVKKGHYSMEGSSWSSVSENAKDLIAKCLEMDPKKRISCKDALKHAWFQGGISRGCFDPQVLTNLRSFSVANRFQRAAMTAVAYQLTPEEQAELREAFSKLDENGDGYLSFKELKQGLECHLNEEHFPDLSKILDSIDGNDDGKVEYTEFIAAAMDHRLQRNESICWRAFKAFDKDGDGRITLNELEQVLKDDELHAEVPTSRSAKSYFEAMDTDKNGEVSFQEFMDMLHSQTSTHSAPGQRLETSIDSTT